jgi:outer membrane lipoprotein-sorting protein
VKRFIPSVNRWNVLHPIRDSQPEAILLQTLWTPLLFLMVAAPVPDETRSLLDRVIRAQGGDEKLSKAQGATFTTKATIEAEGIKVDLTGDVAAQADDHVRWNVTLMFMGQPGTSGTMIVTPDKIWSKGANMEAEESPKDALFIRDVFRTVRLSQNLSALRSKELVVSPLKEVKIDNRPAVGLNIATKGRPDVQLFFDKETYLPLRAEVRVLESMPSKECAYVFSFADYKDVNGIKQYRKISLKRDDKPVMEMELSDFKFQEKVDATLFAKP